MTVFEVSHVADALLGFQLALDDLEVVPQLGIRGLHSCCRRIKGRINALQAYTSSPHAKTLGNCSWEMDAS